MTARGFARVESLFQQARRLPPERRDAFFASACGDDAKLRDEVEQLLAADAVGRHDPFASPALGSEFALEDAASTAVPDSAGRRERIGRYRIIGTLGAGGMGVVHLAEQDQPRRTVALKVIRPGLVEPQSESRFLREAQALGQLSHPGIAQVFEAGVADGIPFIAMERVVGVPLLEFVEREGLERRERLELFCRIADAVQHAHEHGVIHRDLKPTNVLVEGTRAGPRPKVVDFGVARVSGGENALDTLQTRPGELLGTLPYMSPEQALGRPGEVDERSDVHALGVILFELLSGRLPRELRGMSLPEAARRIAEEDPTTLSGVDPSLAGDLDTITATALAREKSRRYGSVAALAEDVRRFLRDEPIAARRPSAADQLGKFVRRHRALVAGAAIVVIALAAGLVATAWQWRHAVVEKERAERRFAELRNLARAFIFDLDPKIRQLTGALDARRAIVRTALEYLDRLAAEAPDMPELLLELAAAYQKTGDIQFSTTLPNLGDSKGALASYAKAYALLERLDREGRDPGASLRDLVAVGLRIGDAWFDAEGAAAAERAYAAVETHLDRWRRELPQDPRIVVEEGAVGERRGNALFALGRTEEALALYRRELTRSQDALAEAATDRRARRDYGVALTKVASCDAAAGRNEAALAARATALGVFAELLADDPRDVLSRRDVAVTEEHVGLQLIALGRAGESDPHFVAALAATDELARADPDNIQVRFDLATRCCHVGERRLAAGDFSGAEAQFTRLLEVAERLAREQPDSASALRHHGVAFYKLAELDRARGAAVEDTIERRARARSAATWLERSLAIFRDLESRGLLRAEDATVPRDLAAELELLAE